MFSAVVRILSRNCPMKVVHMDDYLYLINVNSFTSRFHLTKI